MLLQFRSVSSFAAFPQDLCSDIRNSSEKGVSFGEVKVAVLQNKHYSSFRSINLEFVIWWLVTERRIERSHASGPYPVITW